VNPVPTIVVPMNFGLARKYQRQIDALNGGVYWYRKATIGSTFMARRAGT
jgi:hypothetical protein